MKNPPNPFRPGGPADDGATQHAVKSELPTDQGISSLDSIPFLSSEFSFQPSVRRNDSDATNAYILLENRGVTSQLLCPPEESPDFGPTAPKDDAKLAAYIEFWATHLHWKSSVAAKLRTVGETKLADGLDHCRSEASVLRCLGCGLQRTFYNRCDTKHCPACAPRLSRERKESVEAWANYIGQPKHVVLTCRNTGTLTEAMVKEFKSAFARLRRSKFATEHQDQVIATDIPTRKLIHRYSYPWIGGFYSLEVTKETNGWHLHLHALVDCRYIDCIALSDAWARALRQDIAIVKVKDARSKDYLAEVCKYVVKGDQLAAWKGQDIATLIHAFENVRTFGVFGTLYKRRAEFAAMLLELQAEPEACQCGCRRWEILTDKEAEWKRETGGIPPPSPKTMSTYSLSKELDIFGSSRVLAAIAR